MREARVRAATVADVPVLAAMRRDFTFEDPELGAREQGHDFEEAFAAVVGAGIEAGRWVVAVAEVDGEIVSHAFAGLIDKIPRPTRGSRAIGYLTNVYTRPEHRGRGIGALVIEWLQEWSRANDVELLVVWPSDESFDFYGRLGFARPLDPLVWESGVGD